MQPTKAGAAVRLAVAGALGLASAILVAPPVLAQSAGPADSVSLIELPEVSDSEQMLVEADELIYDNENETVSAVGNVQIYYGPYTLQADRVTYDQGAARVRAEGNVRVTEPDGNVIYAQVADLTDDFRDGFVESLTVETPDRTRIAAASAERTAGNTTVFNRGVYTACEACEKDPTKPPLWQVKSVRIVHDQQKRMIYYENASLEFFGLPVAFFPYFATPDSTVRRKTGFLTPGFRASDIMGFGVEVPYFINVAPNKDLTLRPVITSRQGVLGQAEWRHRTANGSYSIEGAGIYQLDPDDGDEPDFPGDDRDWRGFVRTQGAFAINRNWTFGWDGTVVSDDGFLKSYSITSNNWITSDVYLTGMSDRNYFDARAMHFQRLNSFDFDQSALPTALPNVDYNYVLGKDVLGGELGLDVQAYSLHRGDMDDPILGLFKDADLLADIEYSFASRVVSEVYWRRTLADQWGQLFSPYASVRGDITHTEGGYNASRRFFRASWLPDAFDDWQPVTYQDETVARVVPTLGLEYRYPFASRQSWGTQTLEPIAQLYYRPDLHGDQNDLANEDALSIVFDATSLFDRDKFSGYDRIETGLRANVGFRYTANFNSGGQAQFVFGRSFHLAGDNPFPEDSGLEHDASDYVAAASFEYQRKFRLAASTRIDGETLDVKRTDVSATATHGRVSATILYAQIDAQPALGAQNDSEQVLGSARLKLTDDWSLSGSSRYDIQNDELVSTGLGLTYADECFTLTLSYSQTYDSNEDVNHSVGVRFNLRTLGGITTSTSQTDLLSDE